MQSLINTGIVNLIARNQNGVVMHPTRKQCYLYRQQIASTLFSKYIAELTWWWRYFFQRQWQWCRQSQWKAECSRDHFCIYGWYKHSSYHYRFSRPNTVVEFFVADAGPHPATRFCKTFGQGKSCCSPDKDNATLGTVTDDATNAGTYNQSRRRHWVCRYHYRK